jgi:hypothetical protein
MMTYYEELGVPAEASREEIRQAYKRLVRLLHPDRCGDPATRVLAELQMRRLNGILEVLSHPDERANYDRCLVEGDPIWQCSMAARDDAARREPPDWDGLWCDARWRRPELASDASSVEPPAGEVEKAYARRRARQAGYPMGRQPQRSIGANGFAWWRDARWRQSAMLRSAAALVGVAGLVLFCALMPSSPPVPQPVTQAAANPRPLPAPRAARRARAPSPPPAAAPEEDAPTQTLAGYRPAVQDRPVEAPSPANLEPTETRAAMRAPAAAAGNHPPEEAPNLLSGDWVFVPAAETAKSGYPPEFIELRLREHEGAMRGTYRARYRVADRAISPNVAFQFEGRAGAEGSILPWFGPGGSQGEVTLRLLANGNLRVEWEADRLGEELGLISGAATLVRKLE